MWSVIQTVLVRVAAIRLLYRMIGGLLLVPLAFLLKFVGLPILMVLSVIALPMLLALFFVGLPVFMVLIAGTGLMILLGMALKVGLVAVKIGLMVILPLWLAWHLARYLRDRLWPRPAPASDAAV